MGYSILSPHAIWDGFRINGNLHTELINEWVDGDNVFTEFYILGEKVADGQVKIYAKMVKSRQVSICPAIVYFCKFGSLEDERLIECSLKDGYCVLIVDLAGWTGNANKHTIYPNSKAFARFEEARSNYLYEGVKDINKNCWIEWTKTARYAIKYLSSLPFVTKIGAIANGRASISLWHAVATENKLACAVIINNTGWRTYKGVDKFDNMDPAFDDNELSFISSIEPQSYAKNTKCPCLVLVATNINNNDFDRAFDTVSRIDDRIYKAFDCSVGRIETIEKESIVDVELFFKKFLFEKDVTLPKKIHISAGVINGEVKVEVIPDIEDLKDVIVYYAEEELIPSLRCYKFVNGKVDKKGKYTFSILPNNKSKNITLFARAKYKNGFIVSSYSVKVNFDERNIKYNNKPTVVFTSRNKEDISIFTSADDKHCSSYLDFTGENEVILKEGPMDICGAYCKNGLLSFYPNIKVFKPKDDSILMLDVFVKNKSNVCVSLIADYFGKKVEYSYIKQLNGGDVWHNLKISKQQFKTNIGMPLKDYECVEAIRITADEDLIVNNILWV